MTREEQILKEAAKEHSVSQETAFDKGAKWADKHPYDKWKHSSQEQPNGKDIVLAWDGDFYSVDKYIKVYAPHWCYEKTSKKAHNFSRGMNWKNN